MPVLGRVPAGWTRGGPRSVEMTLPRPSVPYETFNFEKNKKSIFSGFPEFFGISGVFRNFRNFAIKGLVGLFQGPRARKSSQGTLPPPTRPKNEKKFWAFQTDFFPRGGSRKNRVLASCQFWAVCRLAGLGGVPGVWK